MLSYCVDVFVAIVIIQSLSYLLEEKHNILETCEGDLESVRINGHMDEDGVSIIIDNFLVMRIARISLHSYMSQLNHLPGVNNTRGWEACLSQIKYHSKNLSLIRGKYRHRVQMIFRVYTYLRDGMNKTWTSLKLQQSEITILRSKMSHKGGDGAYTTTPIAKVHYMVKRGQHIHGRIRLRQRLREGRQPSCSA